MKLPKLTALLFAGSLALSVAACGKPTVEGAESRYKANKDKISVLITKQPKNKAEFDKKLAEFEQEYKEAIAASTDEEKIKKLGALNSRMEKYLASFDTGAKAKGGKGKTDTKQGGAGAPSKKLDGASGGGTQPAAGGKLGGSAPAGGSAPSGGMGGGSAQPASGGMGGGSAPAGGSAKPASGGMGGM